MFLTITSILVAALFGAAAAASLRMSCVNDNLRKRLKDLKDKNQEINKDKDRLKHSIDNLCASMDEENVTYYASPCTSGSRCVVLRRCFIDGKEYHTFIKDFNDEDADFNRSEAEELCDNLNSQY